MTKYLLCALLNEPMEAWAGAMDFLFLVFLVIGGFSVLMFELIRKSTNC